MLPPTFPSCLIYGYIDRGNDVIVVIGALERNPPLSQYVERIGGIVELEEVSQ
jgi:hypothetical protein